MEMIVPNDQLKMAGNLLGNQEIQNKIHMTKNCSRFLQTDQCSSSLRTSTVEAKDLEIPFHMNRATSLST